MARYIDKDKVIEYVKQRLIPIVTDGNTDDWERGADNERINFLSYIDSLTEEHNEDLEKAAYEYANEANNYVEWSTGWESENDFDYVNDAFKAGAEWQKQQMMKDAVEGLVGGHTDIPAFINLEIEHKPNVKVGDKVKIVVLKTE